MKPKQFLIVLVLSLLSPLAAQDFETPPVLQASQFLEKEFLKSDYHEVASEVSTSGLLNHYNVQSSIGPFEVLGTEMVKVRIREIHAIEKLRTKRAPGAAAKGLGQQLKFEAEVLGKVITKPVQSAVAISSNNDLADPLYFDYASWSEEASGFAESFLEFSQKAGTKKVVIVSPGEFSARANRELKSLGYDWVKPAL